MAFPGSAMIAAADIDILACDEAGFRDAVARSLGPTLDSP
jgi:hypothetical protein